MAIELLKPRGTFTLRATMIRRWWKQLLIIIGAALWLLIGIINLVGQIQTVADIATKLKEWIPIINHFGLPPMTLFWAGGLFIFVGVGSLFLPSREVKYPESGPVDDSASPFVTLDFPEPDLMSSAIRTDYVFAKNIGERPALDVQVADITKRWGNHTYTAKFPRLQILDGKGGTKAVTPEVYEDGQCDQVHSMISRVRFGALLIGDDTHINYKKEVPHAVSISYTDRGISKINTATLVGKYVAMTVFASIKDQR
jgi:hypothetical protein